MAVSWKRIAAECAVGVVLAAAVVACWGLLRGGLPFGQGLEMMAMAGLAAAVAAGWTWFAWRRNYRQALTALARQVADFRVNPTARRPLAPIDWFPGFPEARKLHHQLEALGSAYRQALADRVAQDEALESFRSLVGRTDIEGGKNITVIHRGSGSSRNMVARLTPNLHWMTATPALQQFLGYRFASLSGRPFLDIVHPDNVMDLTRGLQEALETGEAHNITFRVLARHDPKNPAPSLAELDELTEREIASPGLASALSAAQRHVQMDVMTRYTEDGAALHFRCYLVDITDRMAAEDALRRRTQELSQANVLLRRINEDLERLKESYRDLYHHAPVMYFSLEAGGHFVTCNDTMGRNLGYQRDDLVGQPYRCLLTPEGQRRFGEHAGAFHQPGEIETQWVKKDGTVIDVLIRTTPVQDADGQFVRSRSAAHDITERKRLADELRRRGDELEHANLQLRRTNRELDDFTHVVSHDLKEPLRTLQTFSTFLADDYGGVLGGEGTEYINYLVQASRRLGSLIDDLLALGRAGRVIHAPVPFDMAATIATVLGDLAGLVQHKGARVRVAGHLPWAIGDPLRISQLLANLIGNGLKYNQNRHPQVVVGALEDFRPAAPQSAGDGPKSGETVGHHAAWPENVPASPTPDPQRLVTFYVRDNGIGIDQRYHEQIFGIFRRLHLAEEYEGTGAGLAICKKIVEAHSGRIWVESEPGQGATFFFTLPALAAPPAADQPATGSTAATPTVVSAFPVEPTEAL